MLKEAAYYARMALGLSTLARTPTPSDPDALIRSQIAARESHFLYLARRVVFSNPDHPYSRMLQAAGCTLGDLEASIAARGLESTLESLRQNGVWLSHDEFKGKKEIVRSGLHIPSNPMSFRNPLVRGLTESSSSGSRSKGTLTRQVPAYTVYRDAHHVLASREWDLASRAEIQIRDILPAFNGIGSCLRAVRLGSAVDRWFAVSGTVRQAGHYRAATQLMVALANAFGSRVPFPSYLPHDDFSPAAAWIALRRAQGIPAVVHGSASSGVRTAAAALERKLDISGTVFFTGGEALTEAKRALIESAGGRPVPVYWIHEIGPIGIACRSLTGNSVHHFRDISAVIACRRRPPLSETVVSSLLFTTLLRHAPRFFINVEMDDAGALRPASCDCEFSRAGFSTTIHDIFSYGKLTGQGMTLVGTDLLTLLELRLPSLLGGSPGDYQLVEEEGPSQTQITLRVSPRAGAPPDRVRSCFLSQIRACQGGAVASRVWDHAGAVRVVVAEPFVTRSGKVLPLHLLGAPQEVRK